MTTKTLRLPKGPLHYRDEGEGPPVLFVHGLMVNGALWRQVVPDVVAAGFRCVVPELPLGSHPEPRAADADQSPRAVARLLADLLDELDLRDVIVVANDTGGALTQLLMAYHPERLGGVVLTPCDAFEKVFPSLFAALPKLAWVPGAFWGLGQLMRFRAFWRLPVAYGWLTHRPVPDDVVRGYVTPLRRDPAIRRDVAKFLRRINKRDTLAAAREFPRFRKPVLLAWAPEDRVFPLSLAQRLADALPDARIVEIEDSLTFVSEDQPAALAKHIIEFARDMAD